MNSLRSADTPAIESTEPIQAVLVEVTCSWDAADDQTDQSASAAGQATAVVVHASRDMLVLETIEPRLQLPPPGTLIRVSGDVEPVIGRLAELGRNGRFLLSVGRRPVRRVLRLRVSLPGTLRSATVPQPLSVEIADLATGGARVRGIELPVGEQVLLDFTPPGRDQPVTVRAVVAHGTHAARQPWIGLAFRLVAIRGGR